MKIILYTLKSELDSVTEKLNFHQHKFLTAVIHNLKCVSLTLLDIHIPCSKIHF